MKRKYQIIAEYRNLCPFISYQLFDTFEDAQETIEYLMFGKLNRVWIREVHEFSDGSIVSNQLEWLIKDFGV